MQAGLGSCSIAPGTSACLATLPTFTQPVIAGRATNLPKKAMELHKSLLPTHDLHQPCSLSKRCAAIKPILMLLQNSNTRHCPARVLFATFRKRGGDVPVAQNANGEPWAILPPTQLITPSTASKGLGVEDPGPPAARRDTKSGRHIPPAGQDTS